MNEEIIRIGLQVDLSGRVERCVLRLFGYVEEINDEIIEKRMYVSGVEGRVGTGEDQIECG